MSGWQQAGEQLGRAVPGITFPIKSCLDKVIFTARERFMDAAQISWWIGSSLSLSHFWVCYQKGKGNVFILQDNRIPMGFPSLKSFCECLEMNCGSKESWKTPWMCSNKPFPACWTAAISGKFWGFPGRNSNLWFHLASNLKDERSF